MKLIDRETDGYIVEIAEGGPWLGHDLTVTVEYQDRGIWPTFEEARQALTRSLKLSTLPTS